MSGNLNTCICKKSDVSNHYRILCSTIIHEFVWLDENALLHAAVFVGNIHYDFLSVHGLVRIIRAGNWPKP